MAISSLLFGLMTPSEAFALVALVAVACDGALDHDEARALRSQLDGRTPYRSMSAEAMAEMFDGFLARLRQEGWKPLLKEAIAVLSLPQRETALAMAVHLVHSNHVVDASQEELLASMADQLDLPAQRLEEIVEVVSLLNRDSLAI